MVDKFKIKTKIDLIDYKTNANHSSLVAMIMQRKNALICDSEMGESITQFMNERLSIQFHLSEQKIFLSFLAIAMRKSLPEKITNTINRM